MSPAHNMGTLGEKFDKSGIMWGWFWVNVGTDSKNHHYAAKGNLLTCLIKIMCAKVTRTRLGGMLVLVQEWFGEKGGDGFWEKVGFLLNKQKMRVVFGQMSG